MGIKVILDNFKGFSFRILLSKSFHKMGIINFSSVFFNRYCSPAGMWIKGYENTACAIAAIFVIDSL